MDSVFAAVLEWLPLEAPARAPDADDDLPTLPGTPDAKRKSGEHRLDVPDERPTVPELGAAPRKR